jgi:hypothetical protein
MATLNFNANTVAPQEAFDVLPAGWYNVRITGSEMKPTKDGTGSYLSLTMTVIDGKAANRKVFDRLNLNNKNPKAVEIAYQTLSSICHATGIIQLQDSTQLHGIPMQVKLKVRPAEGGYSESNETNGYKAVEGGAVVGGSPAQAPAWAAPSQPPQQPAAAPAAQPWQAAAAPQASASASPPWAK